MPPREKRDQYPGPELFVRELTKAVMELVAGHYLRSPDRSSRALGELERLINELLISEAGPPALSFQLGKFEAALAQAVRGVASSRARRAGNLVIEPGKRPHALLHIYRQTIAWLAFEAERERDAEASANDPLRKALGVRPLSSLAAERSGLPAEFIRNVVRTRNKKGRGQTSNRSLGKKLAKSL
jgi:hypothetical protein